MVEAQPKKVPADRLGAREFLDQARLFMADALVPQLSNEARQLLLHQVAISACDAILLTVGLRIAGVDGAHLVRLEEALEQLPGEHADLLDRLDASRAQRVGASYSAGLVASASVEEAEEATRELLALAEEFVR